MAAGRGVIAGRFYPAVGIHPAIVTASNSVSLITRTTAVTITPLAGFIAAPRQGVAPLAVQFTDTSSSTKTYDAANPVSLRSRDELAADRRHHRRRAPHAGMERRR